MSRRSITAAAILTFLVSASTAPHILSDTVTPTEADRIDPAAAPEQPGDVRIHGELRDRVKQHARLKALGSELHRGGSNALNIAKELCEAGADALPFLNAALASGNEKAAAATIKALASTDVRTPILADGRQVGLRQERKKPYRITNRTY